MIWLRALCERLDKNLVLFFDEVDALFGDALLSFLSQLRDGFVDRDLSHFPRSIALIGLRNMRNHKLQIAPEDQFLGYASPFNIIKKSLTLQNFTLNQIASLYSQHTEASGQVFQEESIQRSFLWSEGQPWLVNALACEVVEEILNNDYKIDINASHIDLAADNLI
ncbi:MAG: hypothetical protein LBR53_04880 [Deltaproteobacteria bacterium]|nr:hypothetical protein [Deltaproteobacteria bacterium]